MTDLARCDVPFVSGWNKQEADLRDIPLHSSFLLADKDVPECYDPTGIFKNTGDDRFSNGKTKWSLRLDQEKQGSCGPNCMAYQIDFYCEKTEYRWDFIPSRSFIYYNTRLEEGDVNEDSGVTIRGLYKATKKYGCVPEDGTAPWHMPYNDKDFKTKPTEDQYKHALLHSVLEYQQVPQNGKAVKSLLCQDLPIGFGFLVHESFMTKKVAKSGVMPKPGGVFDSTLGGHAVTAIGYLTNYSAGDQGITDWIIVMNSWGRGWAKDGVFIMPAKEVFLNSRQADDPTAITKVGFKAA